MILLTGDLFTSPTPNMDTCLFACQKMRQLVTEEPLRHKLEYQRGKKKISPFYTLNYPENPQWESATFKVQMPVITLYGKKDRPILQPNMPTPGNSFLGMSCLLAISATRFFFPAAYDIPSYICTFQNHH